MRDTVIPARNRAVVMLFALVSLFLGANSYARVAGTNILRSNSQNPASASLVTAPVPSTTSSAGPVAFVPPRVFAHYYLWWSGQCTDVALKPILFWKDAAIPVSGFYSNQMGRTMSQPIQGDVDADPTKRIERHLSNSALWGISAMTVQWAGLNSGDDYMLRNGFVPAIQNLTRNGIKKSDFFLTLDLHQWQEMHGFSLHQNGGIDLDSPAQSKKPEGNLRTAAQQFEEEIFQVCSTLGKMPEYARVNGRPILFLYYYHKLMGNSLNPTLRRALDRCESANAVRPCVIGDFFLSPCVLSSVGKGSYPGFYYDDKARQIDVLTAYGLFAGYGYYYENDSVRDFVLQRSSRPCDGTLGRTCASQRTRFEDFISNGAGLASRAGKAFAPVVSPQYFKMWRNEGDCEWAIAQNKNEGVGYMPLARLKTLSEHMYDVSRRTIDAQFSELRRLAPTAPFVFITSFNEYAEGTMVDASSSPNPEG